jgi:endonuclease/exonuclease/phosphatase family metal-dependent hydrolase
MMVSMKQIRVATYNIHKGVQGFGPWQRHEIHRMAPALASLQADVVCLQEVRGHNHLMAQRFADWPTGNQAEHLKP